MVSFVKITDEGRELADPQKLRWLLEQAFDDGDRREGWLARLRLGSGVPLKNGESAFQHRGAVDISEAGDFDREDPYAILRQIIEAKEKGNMPLAAAMFDILNGYFMGWPLDTEWEVIETMELAGFGEAVLVDTGIGLPDDE
jgi:hypothetical protein